jgi:hypothetical protein
VLVELEGDGGDPIMEQLCFDSGLLQGRYLDFANKALESQKQQQKNSKAQMRARLRANLAQLGTARHVSDPDAIAATDDPAQPASTSA